MARTERRGVSSRLLKDGSTMPTDTDRGASRASLAGRAARLSTRFRETAREEGLAEALSRTARKLRRRFGSAPVDDAPSTESQYRRERSFRLADLIACPDCGSERVTIGADRVRCGRCGAVYPRRAGALLFAPPMNPITSRLEETHFTHPYGDDAKALIHKYRRGVVLDYGAGHTRPEEQRPNVVLHEAVQYDTVDVASLTPRLPYRDNCFDAIVSQAVFEHVPRPWETAAELHRVLKPGGEIHVDTAFMQPYHSDPFHFFNMTIPGVREIFRPFREVAVGVKPYQLPSFGYRMQLEVMLNHMAPGVWRERMEALLRDLRNDGAGFDRSLDEEGQLYVAAGVYFHGTK